MLDRVTRTDDRLLPALAEALGTWFPELKGRALAVSDVAITKENVPTLPLVMLAFMRGVGAQSAYNHDDDFEIQDNFIISFWMHPVRYKANGFEMPFWSYYPYEKIRDVLLTNLLEWNAPNGTHIAYRNLAIEASSFAVTLNFGFVAMSRWKPCTHSWGEPITYVGFNLCAPSSCWCPEDTVPLRPLLPDKVALTATPLTSSTPAFGTPVLTQRQQLAAVALVPISPELDKPPFNQNAPGTTVLIATSLVMASPTFGTPAFTTADALSATALTTTSPVFGTPTLTLAGALVALDPPVDAAMVSAGKLVDAWGVARLVEGFANPIARVKELSGSTTLDVGADAQGALDEAALSAWQGAADFDLVQFFSQASGGKALVASGTAAMRRSGVYQRFACDLSETDGQLTRSAANGAIGINLAAIGNLTAAAINLVPSAGPVEIHILWAPNNRKKATNDSTDPIAGGTTAAEAIVAYGASVNARWFYQMAGAAAPGNTRVQTSASDTNNANWTMGSAGSIYRWKKFAPHVNTFRLTATQNQQFSGGRRTQATTLVAASQSALAGGLIDGKTLHIGANFLNTSSDTASTTGRGDIIVGAVIITKDLTDLERTKLQAKLSALGQKHRVQNVSTIMGYFDKWFFAKDVVAASGNLQSSDGTLTHAYATAGTFDFAYVIPNIGLKGIRSPTANAANKMAATSNYFSGVISGTLLSLHYNEQVNNSLQYIWAREDQSYISSGLASRGNLCIGFDHNAAGVITRWSYAKDIENLFLGRQKEAATASGFQEWGASIYEGGGAGVNQSMGKYNVNCTHNNFTYNETFTDGATYTLTRTYWETQADALGGAPPYKLDAPVFAPTPENLGAIYRNDCLMLHIANFEPPAGYDPGAAYATRKMQRLSGKVRSYLSVGLATTVGQFDGAFARNFNAGVADGGPNDYIQTTAFQQAFNGTRIAYAFRAGTPLTQAQIEEVKVNAYKLPLY